MPTDEELAQARQILEERGKEVRRKRKVEKRRNFYADLHLEDMTTVRKPLGSDTLDETVRANIHFYAEQIESQLLKERVLTVHTGTGENMTLTLVPVTSIIKVEIVHVVEQGDPWGHVEDE